MTTPTTGSEPDAAGQALPRRWRLRGLLSDSLVRSSANQIGATAVNSVLGYGFWLLAARTYSPSAIGVATALLSAMTFTAVLADFGLRSLLVQALPRTRDPVHWSRTLTAVVSAGAVFSFIGGIVAVLVTPLLSPALRTALGQPLLVLTFLVGVVAWNLSQLLDYTFIAERAAGGLLVRNGAFSAGKLLLLCVPVLLGLSRSAEAIFSTWVVAALVTVVASAALGLPRLGRGSGIHLRGGISILRGLSGSAVGHYVTSVGGQMPSYVLPLIVISRLPASDAGVFYLTWMLGGLFFTVSPSVASALFAEGSHDAGNLRATVRRASGLIAVLLVPPMLFFFFFGGRVLSIFGDTYASAGAGLLLLVVASAAPDAVTNVHIGLLRVQGRLRESALLNAFMGLTAVVGAWFLLPRLGIAGAGAAWLVAQSLGAVWVLLSTIRHPLSAAQQKPGIPAQVVGPDRARPNTSSSAPSWRSPL